MSGRQALDEVARAEGDARRDAIAAHPELLAPELQGSLARELESGGDERLRAALDELRSYREDLAARRTDFVLGHDPIVTAWSRAHSGELTTGAARALAREAFVAASAELYLDAISSLAGRIADAGNLPQALLLQRLLLDAVEARPGGIAFGPSSHHACRRYLTIAARHLRELADGRVFREANTLGRRFLDAARAGGDEAELAETLDALALLHQFPYTAGRRSVEIADELHRWQQRFVDAAGSELLSLDREEWAMPAPADALAEAAALFSERLALSGGGDRGLTLKRAAETDLFRRTLGEPVDAARIADLLRQALADLDPWEAPGDYLGVLNMLSVLDERVEAESLGPLLERSTDEWARVIGFSATLDILRQAALNLRRTDSARARELLRSARPLATAIGEPEARRQLWLDELNALGFGGDPPTATPPDIEAAAADLRVRADAESWDVARLAASLLWLAQVASERDAELTGLALLDEIAQLAPLLATEYRESLSLLRATLQMNLAVTRLGDDDVGAALEPYLQALAMFTQLELPAQALDTLDRIRDLARHSGAEGAVTIVIGLLPVALQLENALGDPATRYVQEICKHAIAQMSTGPVNPEALVVLVQIAKGLRFSVQLGSAASYAWTDTDDGRELLRQIEELERELAGDPVGEPSAGLREGLLLSPYAADSGQRTGNEAADHLANLRHAYDRHVNEQLTAEGDPLLLNQATLQAALDPRTVLLSPYLGATADGRIAVTTVWLTDGDIGLVQTAHDFPDSVVQITDSHGEYTTSPFAFFVQQVREELAVPPDPLPLTAAASESLASTEIWFGGLFERLDELRAGGKDHICIVPHGPLHAYPFHLLHHAGAPLAERWAVTYLPNTRMLLSRPGPPTMRTARRAPAAVLALDYGGGEPHRLPPLPEARAEAESIARLHGIEPQLNAQVTETAVRQTLGGARLVHIAAHGRHDVEAPAFQCLYVTPDEGSDGRLSAHELLALDMRATEILTLSACETALGRFDLADNPRGLPATFLLAGVATLVGTLWEVETNASAFFFGSFHASLRDGTPRLDAFVRAQRETRARFPAYRDWGPFYFIGDWLEPDGRPN